MSLLANYRTVLLVASAAVWLAGCDTISEATGSTKTAPDEFAVVRKAPLILPPEYNLRPPQPGAAPLNQTSPTTSAQTALFGADAATIAASLDGNLSSGERLLLAHARVNNASPSIRQQISSDARNMQGADESFTNDILFWNSKKPDTGAPVNADAEAARLEAAKANGSAPGTPPGANPPAPAQPAAEKKDEGGWFDWF